MLKFKAAVIGDIHKVWDDVDLEFFNQSDYDCILIVGDLPGRTHRGLLDVARKLALLKKPAYFIPGNHDGVAVRQLLAELQDNDQARLKHLHRQRDLCAKLREALGPVKMVGYSCHRLSDEAGGLDLIAARPHSMGGPVFSYAPYLQEAFGVSDFISSRDKLIGLFNQSSARQLLVLAHNGPLGLGAERTSIWGKDFGPEPDDFGDRDLSDALMHEASHQNRVQAVLAGHMHHRVKGGGLRESQIEKEGILYINAACVPRKMPGPSGGKVRHHVRLTFNGQGWQADKVLVDNHAQIL